MTVLEQLESMLMERGISNTQAQEIMNQAKPEIDSIDDNYIVTYNSPASDYPPAFYSTLFETIIKPCALKWIDANKPQAWFREIFV